MILFWAKVVREISNRKSVFFMDFVDLLVFEIVRKDNILSKFILKLKNKLNNLKYSCITEK